MIQYIPTNNILYKLPYEEEIIDFGYIPQFRGTTPATLRKTKQETAKQEIIKQNSVKKDQSSKRYADKKQFVLDLTTAYKKALSKKGLNQDYAKYLVAQDALESAWGKSYAGNYNFGNITVGSSGASYTVGADKDGLGRPIKQKFRNYKSLEDYASHKIDLLNNSNYKAFNGDITEFFNRVKAGGYAEDPDYVKKLSNIFRKLQNGGKILNQINNAKYAEFVRRLSRPRLKMIKD